MNENNGLRRSRVNPTHKIATSRERICQPSAARPGTISGKAAAP
jgi:hypothetical protein